MDHAKKFVLMPMDRAQHFSEDHMSELDQEMQTILSKKLPDPEKATLYLQVLQKFVKFPEVNQVKPVTEEPEPITYQPPDIEDGIIGLIPVKHRQVAKNILLFLKRHPDIISWTPNNELILKGNTLPNTNIKALISHLIRNKKSKPLDFDTFKSVLEEVNFPENFVKNVHLKKKLYAVPQRIMPKRSKRKPMYGKASTMWISL